MTTCTPHFTTICYFIPILLLSIVSTAAAGLSLQVGVTLNTDGNPLKSSSGDFSFGFHPLPVGNTYLLSVWYTFISDTIVWYASDEFDDDGVVAPKGSKLGVTDRDGFALVGPQGEPLWQPPLNSGTAYRCVLNDMGNLIILSSDGQTLWQSFDHPRDTLLPTQTISNGGAVVLSRRAENKFNPGRFMLRILDGNLILNTRNPDTNTTFNFTYYNSNSSNSGDTLSYNASGHMYVLDKKGSILVDLTAGFKLPTSHYFRATLNIDGVFAWYYHPKTTTITGKNSSWSVIKSIPDNICEDINGDNDSGACGYNNICSLRSNNRTICQCPPGYSLIDPDDEYGDCKPDFEMNACNEQQSKGLYRMERLPLTDWPKAAYEWVGNVKSEENCRSLCMDDCLCAASVMRAQTCWKKRWPLTNGRQGNPGTGTSFIKVRNRNGCRQPAAVIYALLGTFGFFNVVLIGLIGLIVRFFYHKQIKRGFNSNISSYKHNDGFNGARCFTYKLLEEATDGFKEELGRGACGIVYKGSGHGIISDGGKTSSFIAVKKIDRSLLGDAEKELKAEANIIGQTHHRNLVNMIGFCVENDHRMLVYEFMCNGSLENFLFRERRLQWAARIYIAKGIANGLLYLHEECSTQIIHCDIKPQNILLDESYRPKISDFGLSKLLKLNQFQTQTAIRGTKGYVAPEWFRNNLVDVKVDVYSFGVLLLEIVCCRRCIDRRSNIEPEMAILCDYAIDCYESRELTSLVADDEEALHDMETVERFVKVAIWCIQDDPKTRPTMRQVSLMLEGLVVVLDPPCPVPDSFSITFL